MGANTPKTVLDRAYRDLAARFLERIRDRHQLNTGRLAKLLNKDRSVVSRYLSREVRPPLHVLQFLERSLGEAVPIEVADAFYASEPSAASQAFGVPDFSEVAADLMRQVADSPDPQAKAKLKRELEDLIRKIG
jgi:transcriptional regulator with XRE-family HTH domain